MTETTRDEMLDTIQSLGEFAHGGRVAAIAQEWLDYGFHADDAREWIETGYVFDAASARELEDAGLTPEDVSIERDGEYPDGDNTLGYAYANGDISLERVKELCGKEAD